MTRLTQKIIIFVSVLAFFAVLALLSIYWTPLVVPMLIVGLLAIAVIFMVLAMLWQGISDWVDKWHIKKYGRAEVFRKK